MLGQAKIAWYFGGARLSSLAEVPFACSARLESLAPPKGIT
jgi:hypothetical protein